MNWSSTATAETHTGPFVAWEQAKSRSGFNSSICGWRTGRGYLPSITGVRACLLFYLRFLKLKMFLSLEIYMLVTLQHREPTIILFFWFPHFLLNASFMQTLTVALISFQCNFSIRVSFTIWINYPLCIAAIHQRLESDGTERVEGSMTQRLENILNSKHLVVSCQTSEDTTTKFSFWDISPTLCLFTHLQAGWRNPQLFSLFQQRRSMSFNIEKKIYIPSAKWYN